MTDYVLFNEWQVINGGSDPTFCKNMALLQVLPWQKNDEISKIYKNFFTNI